MQNAFSDPKIADEARLMAMEQLHRGMLEHPLESESNVLTVIDGSAGMHFLKQLGMLVMPDPGGRFPNDFDVLAWHADAPGYSTSSLRDGFLHVAAAAHALGFDVHFDTTAFFPKVSITATVEKDALAARLQCVKDASHLPDTVTLEVHSLPNNGLYFPPLRVNPGYSHVAYRQPTDLLAFKLCRGLRKGKPGEPVWSNATDIYDISFLSRANVRQEGKLEPVFDIHLRENLRLIRLQFVLKFAEQPTKFSFDKSLPLSALTGTAAMSAFDEGLRTKGIYIAQEEQRAFLLQAVSCYEAVFPELRAKRGNIRDVLTRNEMAFVRSIAFPTGLEKQKKNAYVRSKVEQHLAPEYSELFAQQPRLLQAIGSNPLLQEHLEESRVRPIGVSLPGVARSWRPRRVRCRK